MKKFTKLIRNLKIFFWILEHNGWMDDQMSLRKWIKEARYNLGYDDIGEWF